MKKGIFSFYLALSVVVALDIACAVPPENSLGDKLVGKWRERTPGTQEGATMTITSVDSANGQIKGKWVPPTGPAAGKEFEVTGWASAAPPVEKMENVIVVSFSVNLATYGSLTGQTGFLKDNQLITLWHNVWPNSRYEWNHITANTATFTKIP